MRGKSQTDKRTGAGGASAPARRSIVGGDALENLKRRAADLGLILHKRGGKDAAREGGRRGGGGKR